MCAAGVPEGHGVDDALDEGEVDGLPGHARRPRKHEENLADADDCPAQLHDLDDGGVLSLRGKTQLEWGLGRRNVGRSRKSRRLVMRSKGADRCLSGGCGKLRGRVVSGARI